MGLRVAKARTPNRLKKMLTPFFQERIITATAELERLTALGYDTSFCLQKILACASEDEAAYTAVLEEELLVKQQRLEQSLWEGRHTVDILERVRGQLQQERDKVALLEKDVEDLIALNKKLENENVAVTVRAEEAEDEKRKMRRLWKAAEQEGVTGYWV